jgi:hypothetical protein
MARVKIGRMEKMWTDLIENCPWRGKSYKIARYWNSKWWEGFGERKEKREEWRRWWQIWLEIVIAMENL